MKALIVENEVESSYALATLLHKHCGAISVLGVCPDVTNAYERIKMLEPDVIFLDIELDGGSGFELLEKIGTPNFEVIFTTAFSDYALRAIKHACLDYLIKPIRVEDLTSAIEKLQQRKMANGRHDQIKVLMENLKQPPHESKICVPVVGGYVFLNKSDIVMCQAEGNFSILHNIGGEKIVCARNLGMVEEMIDDSALFRCHKSYLININYVKKLWRKEHLHVVLYNDLQAEVSPRKRDELLDLLHNTADQEVQPKKPTSGYLISAFKDYQNLTFREVEILRCVAKGMKASEISNKLYIAVATVKTHRKNLLTKTHAKNTSEMVHQATLLGLI